MLKFLFILKYKNMYVYFLCVNIGNNKDDGIQSSKEQNIDSFFLYS